MTISQLEAFALRIRKTIINAAHDAGNQGVHIGGALSIADVLAVLYGEVMHYDVHNPAEPNRDRLILSKGHDCLALYAVLAEVGFISKDELKENYLQDGGFLPTHPVTLYADSINFHLTLSFLYHKSVYMNNMNRSR